MNTWKMRRGGAAVPAWTIATVLSMLVATIGIQEIASRVAGPLHVGGRDRASEAGFAAGLQLAGRVGTGRFDEPTAEPTVAPIESVPPRVDGPAVATGLPAVTAPPSLADPGEGWDIDTPGVAPTTRWARGGTSEDGQPEHHLEFLGVDGRWQRGYGNNADTTLTTPWISVPPGDGPLRIKLDARMFIEPELDGVLLSWTADGQEWHEVADISGGQPDDPVLVSNFAIPDIDAQRLRIRLWFHSDSGGSGFDMSLGNPAFSNGSHLDVHRVAVVRASTDVVVEPIGEPTRGLITEVQPESRVVMAVGGPSINPYHPEMRDTSPRAYAHPSTYLDGYPRDAVPVWLSLDMEHFDEALAADLGKWQELQPDVLYWFPGTKIVGAIAPFARDGGGWGCRPGLCIVPHPRCDGRAQDDFSDYPHACLDRDFDDPNGDTLETVEWIDGTRWASAAAGTTVGTCADCLVVHVDGSMKPAVQWPAEQSWIDVQVQHQTSFGAVWTGYTLADCQVQYHGKCEWDVDAVIKDASKRQLVVANAGSPGEQVHVSPLAGAPGAVTVSGHDRGHVSEPKQGSHVAANFCLVEAALEMSNEVASTGHEYALATARAGGVYAQALLDARRLLGDTGIGSRQGALALGKPGVVGQGPLADGRLTMQEWRQVVEATASPRPTPDPDGPRCHDGQSHHRDDDVTVRGRTLALGTGQPWTSVPQEQAHLTIGYGAIDEASARGRALAVLRGELDMPVRSAVDAWFVDEYQLRLRAMAARWAIMYPTGP